MKLSGKKLTTAILAGLMGATMFGGSVFAEDTNQQILELQQNVHANTTRISQLENAQSTAKDYSTDIAANKKAIADETTARKDADTKLQGSVDANTKAVADETKARQDADTKLQGSVDANAKAIANEATARTEADKQLDTRITSVKDYLEKQTAADYVSKTDAAVQNGAVAKADKTIGENVTNLDGALAKETAARIGADAAQDKVIQQVNQNVAKGFNDLNQNIGKITDQLNKNDLAEAQARDAADQKLQGNIDAETTARQTDVANLRKNITDSLIAQGKINETLTTTATNLENHLSDTDGRVDKANAEIHTNAGNIAQSKQDIADIQDTLKKADALASKAATEAATQAASAATKAADNANNVANGLNGRLNVISSNQTVTSESDLIKQKLSIGENLTNVDAALHKEIAARIGADKAQDKVIEQVNKNVADGFNDINKNVAAGFTALNQADANETNARIDADQKEAQTRAAEDTRLNTKIDKGFSTIQGQQDEQDAKIGKNQKDIQTNAGKIQNNQDAIKANSGRLDNHEGRIAGNENNIATNAESIKKETNARIDADQKEAQTRGDKDKEHDTAIAANKKAIGDEAAARQADVSRLDNKIHDVSKEVDTVGALSMAMSGLHPLSYDEGDARFQLSAAVGTYDGTEALALGGFYHFNRDSMLSVGVATDLGADEHRMGANVGYTRRIGQGGHVSRPSEGTVSDIMKDIKNLEQKQAKLEQENEQLKQQLAALKK